MLKATEKAMIESGKLVIRPPYSSVMFPPQKIFMKVYRSDYYTLKEDMHLLL